MSNKPNKKKAKAKAKPRKQITVAVPAGVEESPDGQRYVITEWNNETLTALEAFGHEHATDRLWLSGLHIAQLAAMARLGFFATRPISETLPQKASTAAKRTRGLLADAPPARPSRAVPPRKATGRRPS